MIPTGNSADDIRQRLVLLRIACVGNERGDQAKFAAASGITPSEWGNHEHGKSLSVRKAMILRNRWRVTLDWIYCGDQSSLPFELQTRLVEVSEQMKTA